MSLPHALINHESVFEQLHVHVYMYLPIFMQFLLRAEPCLI